MQKDIPVVIHNGSNYDFHLIITELAKEFRSDMKCIPEDKEKYISFLIPLKIEREDGKFNSYNLRVIDSARFMAGSLGTHVNNLSELYEFKCEDKNNQRIKVTCKKDTVFTRCKTCNNRSKQSIQTLKSKFPNTYQLSKGDINKFILLLRKDVYPYEYMNNYNRFDETMLPPKESFYSEINLKDIRDKDYKHARKV